MSIMLYIPKICVYLKVLNSDEVKDLVALNFGEYFKSEREKLYSKLREEQNIRNVTDLLYIFPTTLDDVEKFVKMMQSSFFSNYIPYFL